MIRPSLSQFPFRQISCALTFQPSPLPLPACRAVTENSGWLRRGFGCILHAWRDVAWRSVVWRGVAWSSGTRRVWEAAAATVNQHILSRIFIGALIWVMLFIAHYVRPYDFIPCFILGAALSFHFLSRGPAWGRAPRRTSPRHATPRTGSLRRRAPVQAIIPRPGAHPPYSLRGLHPLSVHCFARALTLGTT